MSLNRSRPKVISLKNFFDEIFGMRQDGNSVGDFVLRFPFHQQQGIEGHGKAAEKHGRCGDDGVQQAGGRHRDADDIIGKGEPKVLPDLLIHAFGKG